MARSNEIDMTSGNIFKKMLRICLKQKRCTFAHLIFPLNL